MPPGNLVFLLGVSSPVAIFTRYWCSKETSHAHTVHSTLSHETVGLTLCATKRPCFTYEQHCAASTSGLDTHVLCSAIVSDSLLHVTSTSSRSTPEWHHLKKVKHLILLSGSSQLVPKKSTCTPNTSYVMHTPIMRPPALPDGSLVVAPNEVSRTVTAVPSRSKNVFTRSSARLLSQSCPAAICVEASECTCGCGNVIGGQSMLAKQQY